MALILLSGGVARTVCSTKNPVCCTHIHPTNCYICNFVLFVSDSLHADFAFSYSALPPLAQWFVHARTSSAAAAARRSLEERQLTRLQRALRTSQSAKHGTEPRQFARTMQSCSSMETRTHIPPSQHQRPQLLAPSLNLSVRTLASTCSFARQEQSFDVQIWRRSRTSCTLPGENL